MQPSAKSRTAKPTAKRSAARPTAARKRSEAQRRFVEAYEAERGEITKAELDAIRAEWPG